MPVVRRLAAGRLARLAEDPTTLYVAEAMPMCAWSSPATMSRPIRDEEPQ